MREKLDQPTKLYKYTSYEGAKATITGPSIKLSRPSAFNDPFDMLLIDGLALEVNEFLEDLKSSHVEFVSGDIDYERLRPGPNKDKIIVINQAIKRASPEQVTIFRQIMLDKPLDQMWNVQRIRERSQKTAMKISEQLERFGIFCASMNKDNLLMWAHYGDHHRGAVLEFEPNMAKDSVLLASRPVRYSHTRPLLYRTALDLIQSTYMMSLFEATSRILLDLIYTKALEWEYEREYRLAIPDFVSQGKSYHLLPFWPEDLSSIYFGCRMAVGQQNELMFLAKKLNPEVVFYRGTMASREYGLEWIPTGRTAPPARRN